MSKPSFKHLGSSKTKYSFHKPEPTLLETFPNPHPKNDYLINLDCLEFTTLCPITSQPDFAKIYIKYLPAKVCVESKSLKLYLFSFRNHGSFHEDVVNTIANTLFSLLKPKYLEVYGDFSPRGGIAIKPLVIKEAALKPKIKNSIRHLLLRKKTKNH